MPMRTPLFTAALATLVLAVGACDRVDRLLAIETPSRLPEDRLLAPANAGLIVSSAAADYECALGGYVVAGGLASGELVDASQTAARWSYDRRSVLATDALYSTANCEGIGVYTPINTARYAADQATRVLEGWTDQQVANRSRLLATAAAYAGYSVVLLAEGFCSGVIATGPELTTVQLLDSAEARFTKAVAAASAPADSNLLRLALVGRARARLGRGNLAGAAEDAARVPASFVYNAVSADNAARRNNRVFAQNNASTAVTVAPYYRAATVQGRADPRVRVVDAQRNAGDQVNPLWQQQKYASLTAPIPVATGVEARLILAEARGGAEGVNILNALRARPGVALPPLTAAEAADFRMTLFDERRRELWLQGNRWFDVKRGNLPLEPAVGAPYVKGGSYGDQRCWPLPEVARLANPNV